MISLGRRGFNASTTMAPVVTTTSANMSMYGDYFDYDDSDLVNHSINCSHCINELCLTESDYALYKSWVGVDTYEMVIITLILIVFLTGVIGNSLVRTHTHKLGGWLAGL